MAAISCAELFTDPDFCDSVELFTRVSRVNDYGENEIQTDGGQVVLMVVQPVRESLTSRPDARLLSDEISVWYRGKLYAEGLQEYCSAIKWRGRLYRVISAQDWTENTRLGWTSANCVLWELGNGERQ